MFDRVRQNVATGRRRLSTIYLFITVVVVVVVVVSRVARYAIERKRLILLTCRLSRLSVCASVCLSVGLSVRKLYCGNTAEWTRMPFGVSRWMRVFRSKHEKTEYKTCSTSVT